MCCRAQGRLDEALNRLPRRAGDSEPAGGGRPGNAAGGAICLPHSPRSGRSRSSSRTGGCRIPLPRSRTDHPPIDRCSTRPMRDGERISPGSWRTTAGGLRVGACLGAGKVPGGGRGFGARSSIDSRVQRFGTDRLRLWTEVTSRRSAGGVTIARPRGNLVRRNHAEGEILGKIADPIVTSVSSIGAGVRRGDGGGDATHLLFPDPQFEPRLLDRDLTSRAG